MKAFLILSFIAVLNAVMVLGTIVSKCTSVDAPLPSTVDVINCTASPCTFYIGSTGVMSMEFRAPRYLEKIKPNALASVMGLNMSYPLRQDDACVGITNTPCPLAEGELIEYTYGMSVLQLFPEVALGLEFSLLDMENNKEPFVCFKLDINLEKPAV